MARGRIEAAPPAVGGSVGEGGSDASDPVTGTSRSVPLSSLSGFRRDLLFVVASFEGTETVPAGVAIAEDLQAVSAGSVSQGRFYQNLRELVADGLVEKRPIDGRTNAYYLPASTAEGLATRLAWEQRCVDTGDEWHPDRERDCTTNETSSGLLGRWQ